MNVKGVVLGLLLVLAMATAAQARIVEYEEGSTASLVIVPQILEDAKVLADGQVAPSEY